MCLGQATKVCGELLGATKAYRVGLALGTSTTTGDLEGEPLARADGAAARHRKRSAHDSQGFVGQHEQVPPMHAALKHNGTPLYELARAGMTVERRPRADRAAPSDAARYRGDFLEFDVECSKGTYVRVLGEDIAARLGTVGHLAALRRLWVEPFADAAMVTLDELAAWTVEAGVAGLPPWWRAVDSALSGLRASTSTTPARAPCARARSSTGSRGGAAHASTTPRASFSGWSTSMQRGMRGSVGSS